MFFLANAGVMDLIFYNLEQLGHSQTLHQLQYVLKMVTMTSFLTVLQRTAETARTWKQIAIYFEGSNCGNQIAEV